jgi:peptidoglycan/LPS O-acetylase OafA/YrhL
MQANSPDLTHPKYRPDIDGLRAVAIISVVLFHAFRDYFKGGFIGVDIFFVISGFLISTILISSLEKNRYSILQFYIKRIRRIFPALITVMVATILFAWLVLFSDEFERFGRHLTSGIAFVSNIVFWRESGYFDSASETKPLLHFWSLAIEEQFYLFWPILLAFLWKKGLGILKLTVFIASVSFVFNIFIIENHPVAAFFLPITRVWELMAGGVLAYITLHRQALINVNSNVQSVLGFCLLLMGFLFIHEGYGFPGWWALLPTFGTFFIISAGADAWLNRTLLSNKVMLWIGNLSYPMYLWHWPLLSFAYILGNGNVSNTQLACIILLTILLSWLTYLFIEKPIRFGQYKAQAIPLLIIIMLSLLGLSLFIQFGKLSPRNNSHELQQFIEARNDNVDLQDNFVKVQFNQEKFHHTKSSNPNTTVLIGDSHALQYVPRIDYLLQKQPENLNTIYLAIHEGCLPVPGLLQDTSDFSERVCNSYRDSVITLLKDPNIKTIILAGCWNCYLIQDEKQNNSQMETNRYAQEPFKTTILQSLKEFLVNERKTKTVYLLLDNPIGKVFDPSNYLHGNRLSGFSVSPMKKETHLPDQQLELRAALLEIANQAGVKVIDPVDSLCRSGVCMSLDANNAPIYKDNNHLRARYVRDQATFIDHALLE